MLLQDLWPCQSPCNIKLSNDKVIQSGDDWKAKVTGRSGFDENAWKRTAQLKKTISDGEAKLAIAEDKPSHSSTRVRQEDSVAWILQQSLKASTPFLS